MAAAPTFTAFINYEKGNGIPAIKTNTIHYVINVVYDPADTTTPLQANMVAVDINDAAPITSQLGGKTVTQIADIEFSPTTNEAIFTVLDNSNQIQMVKCGLQLVEPTTPLSGFIYTTCTNINLAGQKGVPTFGKFTSGGVAPVFLYDSDSGNFQTCQFTATDAALSACGTPISVSTPPELSFVRVQINNNSPSILYTLDNTRVPIDINSIVLNFNA